MKLPDIHIVRQLPEQDKAFLVLASKEWMEFYTREEDSVWVTHVYPQLTHAPRGE